MNVLAVDTSSEMGSVAITSDSQVLAEVRLIYGMKYSEQLFRSIDFLFKQVDIRLEDIDIFAAARGPGSFTGLRVGLAAIEGFAFSSNKPSVGVSTLEAMAWQVGVKNVPLAPMLDVRRDEFYCGLFERQGGELIEKLAPVVLKPTDWFSNLKEKRIIFCAKEPSNLSVSCSLPEGWQMIRSDPYLSVSIARMAVTSRCGPLEPLYVRKFGD